MSFLHMYSHIIMNTIHVRIPLHGMQCLDGWNYMYSISLLCTIITVVPEANRDHLRLLYYCTCICACTVHVHVLVFKAITIGSVGGLGAKILLELHVKIFTYQSFQEDNFYVSWKAWLQFFELDIPHAHACPIHTVHVVWVHCMDIYLHVTCTGGAQLLWLDINMHHILPATFNTFEFFCTWAACITMGMYMYVCTWVCTCTYTCTMMYLVDPNIEYM